MDTIFPTTYIQDELNLRWKFPLRMQTQLSEQQRREIENQLATAEDQAMDVLRAASKMAHVVVVTLAQTGWIDTACRNYFPRVGELLERLETPIIYAQEGSAELDRPKGMYSESDDERPWGLMKGKAISKQIDAFYSQYQGQTWKNIISVGDSTFERFGLYAAASAYMGSTSMDHCPTLGHSSMPTSQANWTKVENG